MEEQLAKIMNTTFNGASVILYNQLLSGFRQEIPMDHYQKMFDYQRAVYELLVILRKYSVEQLGSALTLINSYDPYLADDIILSWCLPAPRISTSNDNLPKFAYPSITSYYSEYADNIKKYNSTMANIYGNDVFLSACTDIMDKKCRIPAHCLEYIFRYIQNYIIELDFCDYSQADYINFALEDGVESSCILEFNMVFLLEVGVGKPVRDFIVMLITQPNMVERLKQCLTKNNYIQQREEILARKDYLLKC